MKIFYQVLWNNLFVTLASFFVWFALVFWLYLGTQSVLATSIVGGAFMALMAATGVWFGSIVDHNKKKNVMLVANMISLVTLAAALAMYLSIPSETLLQLSNPLLWVFVGIILLGVLVGNTRGLALSTMVTMFVPEGERDKANGMVGMIMGLSSSGAGIASGFAIAYAGMGWILGVGVVISALALIHLLFIRVNEPEVAHEDEEEAAKKRIDLRGTIKAIGKTKGLFALIFFSTFNNFLGGVFMSLMDPYGLSLMSVQVWGTVWGLLSFGFIIGGFYISKYGLGKNPVRTLFLINIATWTTCFFFPIQPSIILLVVGILIWTTLVPFIEATEHTIVQKVVPLERQGRVLGFAQSIESAASPITAFMIGPIAQFVFIPFMTTGRGVELIGDWFGVGPGRGMALVFMTTSIIGLVVTLIAMRAPSYKLLAQRYAED